MAGWSPRVQAYFPPLLTVALRLQRRWQAPAAQGQAIDLRPT